jgi:hypothetical protein
MNRELIIWMQNRAANGSVGASTIRGMAPKGTADLIRRYLRGLDLRAFHVRRESAYARQLNAATDGLMKALPDDAKHWGMARKCVNIFMRNCLYNRYLCSHYKLEPLEQWLEIPLDSHVGKGLIKHVAEDLPPKWSKVITLTPEINRQYQEAALDLAKRMRVSRIHLDDWLYRGDHVTQAEVGSGTSAR